MTPEDRSKPATALKRGWTTGACATAAAKAAYQALLTGEFPDPVTITLPKGEQPSFALAVEELGEGFARAGIIKDAGDDPDVTHGALVIVTVRQNMRGNNIVFSAGEGVGIVTKPGLPVAVGEPAINPVPRKMITGVIEQLAQAHKAQGGVEIEISIPKGEKLAKKTWNPRLGIEGGLSILGTTGIVHPFSCSAWIHAIRSGIDVAQAQGLGHVAGATGSTSEAAVKKFHNLPDQALIDMGDFVGGMLKHLRTVPIKRVTVAGGFAKMTKLAQGYLDLHSGRSQVSFDWLGQQAAKLGAGDELCASICNANTAAEVLQLTQEHNIDLAGLIAQQALEKTRETLKGSDVKPDVLIINRQGEIVGRAG